MYANVSYQGDGVQKVYSFSFDYLRKAFVKVQLIDGDVRTDLTQGQDYTVEDRTIVLTDPTSYIINIYRETTTDPLVSWADASVLRAKDMTLQETQLLHLVEETYDAVYNSGMYLNAYGELDATNHKIVNVLAPEDDNDAANKKYVDDGDAAQKKYTDEQIAAMEGRVTDAVEEVHGTLDTFIDKIENKTEEGLTQIGELTEEGLANLEETIEEGVSKVEDTADVRADQISDLYKNLMNAATEAVQKAQDLLEDAQESVIESKASQDNAKVSETNAKESETNAKEYAESAKESADKAESSANSASGSATEAVAAAERAENAAMSTAPVYDSDTTYNFPDLVVFTDGNIYRCVGTDIQGEDPDTSSNWVQMSYVYGDFFDEDTEGDLMPAVNPLTCDDFELDESGDIMPQE